MPTFRSGYVAIIGRPNVGKSSLLNALIAEKLSIITDKAQTTRNRILGVLNATDVQIVFLDTPGLHEPHKELNRYMVETALATLSDADLAVVVAEPAEPLAEFTRIVESLAKAGKPAILVLNKIDLVPQDQARAVLEKLGQCHPFREALAISCLTGHGIEAVLAVIRDALPEGPRFFPEDAYTDLSERFLASEIIREKVFERTHQEIPYAVAVEIEQFREGEPTYISAVIHVERPGQKAIVIGQKGRMLKEIGTQSRLDIQRLLGVKVFLKLFVRVTKDWTKNPHELKRLGYE